VPPTTPPSDDPGWVLIYYPEQGTYQWYLIGSFAEALKNMPRPEPTPVPPPTDPATTP